MGTRTLAGTGTAGREEIGGGPRAHLAGVHERESPTRREGARRGLRLAAGEEDSASARGDLPGGGCAGRDGRFASIIDFHEDRRFAVPKIRRTLS